MAEHALLPSEFEDLEPFVETWALPDMNERYERRLESSMEAMQSFYDALRPRAVEAIAYLNQFGVDDMPEPALRLFWMLGSLSAVGFAIDVFHSPKVIDSAQARLAWTRTPLP
jgi:hypothetical protein